MREVQQTGYVQTFPIVPEYDIDLSAGQVSFNNDFGNCYSPCAEISEILPQPDCNQDTSRTYCFTLTNLSDFDVTDLILNGITPGCITFDNGTTHSSGLNIPSGASLEVCVEIGCLNTFDPEACFRINMLSNGYACCHTDICIPIEAIDPCEFISTSVEPGSDRVEECCWVLTPFNNYCDSTFIGLGTEILTDGIVFSDVDPGNTWFKTGNNSDIFWSNTNNSFLPLGNLPPLRFCLDSIIHFSQVPQRVALHWYTQDANGEEIIACSDTLEFECQPCTYFTEEQVECGADSAGIYSYDYKFTLFNNAGRPYTQAVINPIFPSGLNFTPSVFNAVDGPTFDTEISGVAQGTTIGFKVTLLDENDEEFWCCHADTFLLELPLCDDININPMTGGPQKVKSISTYYNNRGSKGVFPTNAGTTNRFTLFPNPTNGQMQMNWPLEYNPTAYRIYNSMGKLVLQEPIDNIGGAQVILSNKASGIYWLELLQNNHILHRERIVYYQQ